MNLWTTHFAIVCTAFTLGGVVSSLIEGLTMGQGVGALALAMLLAAVMSGVCGLVAAVVTSLLSVAMRRFVDAESPTDAVERALSLLVLDGGFTARAIAVSVIPFVVSLAMITLFPYIAPRLETNFEKLLPLYAAVTTGAAVLGVLLARLLAWRRPRLAPCGAVVWGSLSLTAYYVAITYWMGASHYTVWGAVPIIFALTGATVFVVMRQLPRLYRPLATVSLFLQLAGVVTLFTYPGEGSAHAELHSGPILGSGSWQILAMALDFDGDGTTSLGGLDCDRLNFEGRIAAMETVSDGIDNNCMGGDLKSYPSPRLPAPKVTWNRSGQPNVIAITVDALRADAVGKVVAERPVTPAIDALMEGAVVFENGYAVASSTDESVPAMWTGMYPADWHQHGVYFGVEPTVADLLRASGYETIAVIVHPWLPVSIYRGFDLVDNSQADTFRENARTRTGPTTTRLALEHLDARDESKPLFIWVHYFDTHLPRLSYNDLRPWLGNDAYLHATHLVDSEIGQLLAGLDERGLVDDSVILFASDHGEGLGDHNIETHSWSIWESLIRVPFAMRLPGLGAQRVKQRVSTISLAPTLYEYLGIQDVVDRDAPSLVPLIVDPSAEAQPIFFETPVAKVPTHFAVIDGDMKYWIDYQRGAFRLFDVAADPGEQHNLISERPEEAARLNAMLGEWRDSIYNNVRLERKRDLWESRAGWEPKRFIGSEESVSDDEMPE